MKNFLPQIPPQSLTQFLILTIFLIAASAGHTNDIDLAKAALKRPSNYPVLTNYSGHDFKKNMQSKECEAYDKVAHNKDQSNPLNIHQLQVYKGGYLVDEFYKKPLFDGENIHVMMSTSKPVTATILDAAIQAGLKWNGQVISYATKLSEFFPHSTRIQWIKEENQKRSNSDIIKVKSQDQEWYNAITLEHLTKMQSGLKWDESYNNPLGDFITALYGEGINDIVRASLVVPMERPPGQKFNYSGGNANVTQGILKMLGKENFGYSAINKIAKKLLFDRIEMKSAYFELDKKHSAIGSTYLFLKPQDMARLGHLYLNSGRWKGQQILTDRYVNAMRTLNSGVDRVAIDEKYLSYIESQGAPSNAITWLNKDIFDNKGQLRYGKEFPSSPSDLFFLAGHNGQVIFMLPTEDLVIVMTGNNDSYWDKVDKLIHHAANCFRPLEAAPNLKSTELLKKYSEPDRKSITRKLKDSIKLLGPGLQLGASPIPTAVVAKELCSCIFVTHRRNRNFSLRSAIRNCPGDVPALVQRGLLSVDVDRKRNSVSAVWRISRRSPRTAKLGEFGCRLQ